MTSTSTSTSEKRESKPLILRIVSRMAIGGVQRGILNTLARADREKFDYALLCTKKEGVWGAQVRELGIPLYVQKTLPSWNPFQITRLAWVIRKIKPDLVHIHMAPTVIPAATAAKLAGVKHIVIQHHNVYGQHWAKLNPLLRNWEFKLTRAADAVLAVSEAVAECTRRELHLPQQQVITVLNGIDLQKFQQAEPHDPRPEWGVAPGTPLVLLVSRYLETKHVEDFIRAAAIYVQNAPKGAALPFFAIVGDGPEYLKQRYEREITKAGTRVPVRLMGGRHDLPNILPHASVGVVTSEMEGCPNTILEYLAAGVPIAASNIAPIAEIVQNEREALLHPVCDAPALANNIARLLSDRPLAEEFVRRGREIIGHYDWNNTIRQYEKVYERVLVRVREKGNVRNC